MDAVERLKNLIATCDVAQLPDTVRIYTRNGDLEPLPVNMTIADMRALLAIIEGGHK